jgi:CheY-like chemotaxis protein
MPPSVLTIGHSNHPLDRFLALLAQHGSRRWWTSGSPLQGSLPMLRILVVDDCLDSATTLQWLLRAWGHEACIATDGPKALDLADSFQPDVVVLDIGLPGIDGYEVTKRLREPHSEKPFAIAHSGYCSDAEARRSLEAGCIAHLCKPVDPQDIRQLVETCEKWLPV